MPSYLDVIRRHYPHALATGESVDRMFNLLQRRYALLPAQIMFADSICSDDLNSIEYPERAYEMLGPFKMGGLNGFPFTGLTGMGAFAHHVPEQGAVFVFYAPHIGITRDGENDPQDFEREQIGRDEDQDAEDTSPDVPPDCVGCPRVENVGKRNALVSGIAGRPNERDRVRGASTRPRA